MHNYHIDELVQEHLRRDFLAEADQYRMIKEAQEAMRGQEKPQQSTSGIRATSKVLMVIAQILSFFFVLISAAAYNIEGRYKTINQKRYSKINRKGEIINAALYRYSQESRRCDS